MNEYINQQDKPDCPYQETVACDLSERRCNKCGWNPEVAEQRLKRMFRERRCERCRYYSKNVEQKQRK